jgi:hypothetical protein
MSAASIRLVCAWLAFGVTGCAPRDPLERVISVPTVNRLTAWRSHAASDYNVDTVRRIEEALQEIRLSISGEQELKRQMGERVTGGTEAIDEAVRVRVDGRTLREVLQLGYELRVRRLKEELVGLEDAMSKNAQLVTRPGDLDSKHHLEGLRDRQGVRVEKYQADIAAAESYLAPLIRKSGRRLLETSTGSSEQLPLRIQKEKSKIKV